MVAAPLVIWNTCSMQWSGIRIGAISRIPSELSTGCMKVQFAGWGRDCNHYHAHPGRNSIMSPGGKISVNRALFTEYVLSRTCSVERVLLRSRMWKRGKPFLARTSLWSAGSSTPQALAGMGAEDAVAVRNSLKEKLLALIESVDGNLNDECLAVVEQLQKYNPNPSPLSSSNLYEGYYESIKSTFKGTGRKGERQKGVGYAGSKVTLGRISFNSFKPVNLEISLNQTYNHLYNNGLEQYIITFFVQNPIEESVETSLIEGLLINNANYSVASSIRLDVMFSSAILAPRYPEKDMKAWREIFEEANPGMDKKGQVTVSLPPAKGWTEYLYLDDDLRISKGNMGSITVVRKLKEPVIASS